MSIANKRLISIINIELSETEKEKKNKHPTEILAKPMNNKFIEKA